MEHLNKKEKLYIIETTDLFIVFQLLSSTVTVCNEPVGDFKSSRWREGVEVVVCGSHSAVFFILSIHCLLSA